MRIEGDAHQSGIQNLRIEGEPDQYAHQSGIQNLRIDGEPDHLQIENLRIEIENSGTK